MKLTKSKLQQMIKEELGLGVTEEGYEVEHPGHKDYLEFPGMWDDYAGLELFWDDLNELLTKWDPSHPYSKDLRNIMVDESTGGRGLE